MKKKLCPEEYNSDANIQSLKNLKEDMIFYTGIEV
jgi:hypothetical protein